MLPSSITIERTGSSLRIRRAWNLHTSWTTVAMAVFWWGYIGDVLTHHLRKPDEPWGWIAVLIAITLVSTYRLVVRYVNQTVLRIEAGKLTVANGPLPWPGNREYSRESLADVIVVSPRKSPDYVAGVLRDGRKMAIAGGFLSEAEALCLAQEIRRGLGLS